MNCDRGLEDMSEHREISALIPWYVNGNVGAPDRQRIESHLRDCALCRDDALLERRVFQCMTVEPGVEYMPRASLKRLQARLDGLVPATAPMDVPAEPQRRRRPIPWQYLSAGSAAAVIVSFGLLAADRWRRFSAGESASNYHTVTSPAAKAPDVVIRAVFSPTLSLEELQAILKEAHVRIASGPTDAGVYSLAAATDRPVSSSLAILRRHAGVRFCESIQPNLEPGAVR